MNTRLYQEQLTHWPTTGKHILALVWTGKDS